LSLAVARLAERFVGTARAQWLRPTALGAAACRSLLQQEFSASLLGRVHIAQPAHRHCHDLWHSFALPVS